MSAAPRRTRAQAPAKVNLWLAVHGRRANGFHDLTTLMLALDLADDLCAWAGTTPGISLRVEGAAASADIPTDDRNLVSRAAAAVLQRARELGHETPIGLEFTLSKRIPSQAGLGGGSSDAATALALAEDLLEVDLGDRWRRSTLAALGADCVFFHDRGGSSLALCEGFGDRVSPWIGSAPPWSVALIVPAVACPTAAVFAALEVSDSPPRQPPFEDTLHAERAEYVRVLLHNDLEAAALNCVPELREWRELLDAHHAHHFRLTGSGSSFFSLYDEPHAAREELKRLMDVARERGLAVREHLVCRARRDS